MFINKINMRNKSRLNRCIIQLFITINNIKHTIFNLLPITWWFFKCFNHQWWCRRHNRNSSYSVLDSQFNSDLQTFPIRRGFGNIITNFLGGLKYIYIKKGNKKLSIKANINLSYHESWPTVNKLWIGYCYNLQFTTLWSLQPHFFISNEINISINDIACTVRIILNKSKNL